MAALVSSTSFLWLLFGIAYSCPSGWTTHQYSCYHFSHDTENWTGAMDMCKILGGHLVEINDATEQLYVASQAKLYNKSYWIALTDVAEENTWMWMNTMTPLRFSNWDRGEPNNLDRNENCALLLANGLWNDEKCFKTASYICEMEEDVGSGIVG